ncbi:hypothetical protein EDD21DRAFT_387724 [Dissophora ornata]|nr:hypothetical protein EDD21DRAFT_387724 [Dissophora ornata]
MYYPNAWDLPEDPRRAHPPLTVTPLVIEDTTNKDDTSVPSGKGKPVFPWESSGRNTPKSPRTPTRTYYNYTASAEERRREKELEAARQLEIEEQALEQIRMQEYTRYELERKRQEAQEKMTGSQAFENFRLVNAWDVDVGVQRSILQKTEKRRPRSRRSSVGGIRKGYGLEDMLAYEAKQRQEQYEAELVRERLEEEERWQREQEEARIKEEELRLEKVRLARLTKLREEQRQKQQQESSYSFRNAWDPPNMALAKKKLRIEDEDVGLALPLRQNRRSTLDVSDAGAIGSGSTRVTTVTRPGSGGSTAAAAAAAAAGAAGAAIAGLSRSGHVQRPREELSEETTVDSLQREARTGVTRSEQTAIISGQRSSAATGVALGYSGSNSSTATTTNSNSSVSASTTTKMTAPGSHRFVRTTVTTTVTRRKFRNGAVVSSSTNSSTTGGERMFEIPAGPRYGSYFGEASLRTVTTSSSREASRLTTGAVSSATHGTQRMVTSGQSSESSTSHVVGSSELTESHQVIKRTEASSHLRKVGERTTSTTTTTVMLEERGQMKTLESTSSEVVESGSVFAAGSTRDSKRQGVLPLQIDTTGSTLDRNVEEGEEMDMEEQQRRLDLRNKNASAAVAAEAMIVLSKYPQATNRYSRRPTSTSSTTSSTGSKYSTGGVLYANDPNLPRQSTGALVGSNRGKSFKVQTVRATSSGEEDEFISQDEDSEELEYFGEKHTRATFPLGSPYMPSTPLASSGNRYATFASGFSSRTGSRPTTPGLVTPSRLGPGTPKAPFKRSFDFKQLPEQTTSIVTGPSSTQQTAPIDTGFSNYKIEWNWKELLGKKPRHWTAEAGEEYYDPYNALSTRGSLADSDEDDGPMLGSSSDEDTDEEEAAAAAAAAQRARSGGEGKGFGSASSSPAFSTGEDSEFTRESGFVIRGGKIARRRSSMALDRAFEV